MTQKDKELLLKDLCARLPYGVKVQELNETENALEVFTISAQSTQIIFGKYKGKRLETFNTGFLISPNNSLLFKPYLRPMSSMTEEERTELSCLSNDGFKFYLYTYEPKIMSCKDNDYLKGLHIIDWLNAHHFDYRGLIEKGLAIEAPEGMYKKGE